MRIETDSLGAVEVEDSRYWGAQTQRSLEHFRIGVERMPIELVHALALVKKAAAFANVELGALPPELGSLVGRAADEVLAGLLDEHFPLSVWQTGSGTQTNMNVNEVIANRANELAGAARGQKKPIHPNDHVNRSHSSNDAFPTAMHVAAYQAIAARLLPAGRALEATLGDKARAYAGVVKIGRTHLMDATPLTLGQEIGGWSAALGRALDGVEGALEGLAELAIGGTAVGTGLNAPAGFGELATKRIAELAGLPFVPAPNKFQALASHEALLFAHGALETLAAALTKIANDVRWLASGPRAGLGELRIPENEPGSSIMPGKVNPTQCEAMTMVCARVLGNGTTVKLAGAAGNFELNVFKPVLAQAVLQSVRLLGDACASFDAHCARGIEPDRERMARNVEQSLMLVTALSPAIGYDAAARVAKKAHDEGTTLKVAAVALGVITAEDFDRLVRPEAMLGPSPAK